MARTTYGLSTREAGACSSGEGEPLPGGDRAAGLARGWGRGWQASRGVWTARGLSVRRRGRGEPRHPRRRREGTPIPGGGRWLPRDYSWQRAGCCLGARQLGGGVGTARRGGRVSRREPWGRAPGARAVGAARLGACRDAGLRGLGLPEAAAGDDAPGGDAGGLRSRGPSGRSAPGSGRSPGAASRRRAAVRASAGTRLHLPQPRRRPGMGGERVRPGSSSSPSDPALASARGGNEARPCCRFLREPRLGEVEGAGASRADTAQPSRRPARTGERLAAAPAAPPRPGGGGGRCSGSRGKVTARQFPVHVSCAARSSR